MSNSKALVELSGTSQASPSALPDTWINRLFERMEDRYGDLWANRYGAFPRARVMRSWAEDLADMSREELARGVEACRYAKFPPTLPEFVAFCRPPVDFESLFVEAVQQMAARESGKDHWSCPAVFWAAVTIGAFDLRNSTWPSIEKRWRKVLQAELDKGEWQPIPERAIALPTPSISPKGSKAVGTALSSVRFKEVGDKEWVQKAINRIEAGEVIPFQAEKMALEASTA